jgi:hypothetical protein
MRFWQAILDISNLHQGNRLLQSLFSLVMTERIDFWRGFTGGFLAGVAIGAFIYFSPAGRDSKESAQYNNFDSNGDLDSTDEFFPRRDAAESAGDPSRLVHQTAGASRIDYEHPGQRLA